ncbi:hypothetical protein OUZ56_013830 [Daphnia magna]|uniref:Uncharacterized protein n=1 Tax=Daphnia magna TaxID=35525 RepID=A0ABQ9Z724_9CRUS|nr:hypothetical protein OUZ56_013830 [Daphnia magna]
MENCMCAVVYTIVLDGPVAPALAYHKVLGGGVCFLIQTRDEKKKKKKKTLNPSRLRDDDGAKTVWSKLETSKK